MPRQEHKTTSLRRADWAHARDVAHHNSSTITQTIALSLRLLQRELDGYDDEDKPARFRELLAEMGVD